MARPVLVPPLQLGAQGDGPADERRGEAGGVTPRTTPRGTPLRTPRGAGLVSPRVHDEFMRGWMQEMDGEAENHADQMLAEWRMNSARKTSPLAQTSPATAAHCASADVESADSSLFDSISSASSLSSELSDEPVIGGGGGESRDLTRPASSGVRHAAGQLRPERAARTGAGERSPGSASVGEGLHWTVRESRPQDIARLIAAQSQQPCSSSPLQSSPPGIASPTRRAKCDSPRRLVTVPVLNLGQLRRAEGHAQLQARGAAGEGNSPGMLPLDVKLQEAPGPVSSRTRLSEASVSAAESASTRPAGLREQHFSSPPSEGAGRSTWMPMSARGTSWTGNGSTRSTWSGADLSPPSAASPRWGGLTSRRVLTPRDRQISLHRWQGAIKLQQHARCALKVRAYKALKIEARDEALKSRFVHLCLVLCALAVRCKSDGSGNAHRTNPPNYVPVYTFLTCDMSRF